MAPDYDPYEHLQAISHHVRQLIDTVENHSLHQETIQQHILHIGQALKQQQTELRQLRLQLSLLDRRLQQRENNETTTSTLKIQ